MPIARAAVFDLDGTLVDSAPDLHLVLGEVMGEIGLGAPELPLIRAMVGDGARVLLARALTHAGRTLPPAELERLYDRFIERYTEEPCRGTTLFPDAVRVLEGLGEAGWKVGLCTNKPEAPTVRLIEILGIDHLFQAVVGGDTLAVRKPDAGHLTGTLERMGAGVVGAVMVGDSKNDLLVARAAAVPCILVSFGYTTVPAAELGADLVVDHFAELPAALDRLVAAA